MTQTITIDADKGREIAAIVAQAIRRACGKLADQHGDIAHQIDDTCDAAVDAAMQALADAFIPTIYERPERTYRNTPWPNKKEAEARTHYEGWDDQPSYVPWVLGGNSLKQDEARDIVRRRVLAATPAPSVPAAMGGRT